MAKEIKINQKFNNSAEAEDTYSEGPFVIANNQTFQNKWETRCECKGLHRSVTTHQSVDNLLSQQTIVSSRRLNTKDAAIAQCNWLNQQVKKGVIVLSSVGDWIAK